MRCVVLALVAALCFAAPASGADPDELMPGQVAIVKAGKLAKFVSKAAPSTTFDMPDPSSDPVAQGGTLNLFDTVPRPNGDFTFPLLAGASRWKALGSPPGSKGYKYKGAGTPGDPCKVVLIKPTIVKAVCKGTDVAFALPFQGDLGVVLTAGSAKRYCAEFGGAPAGDPAKLLKRKAAPSATACPTIVSLPTATPTDTQAPTMTATPTETATVTPISCGASTVPACGGFCGLGTCVDMGGFCGCL